MDFITNSAKNGYLWMLFSTVATMDKLNIARPTAGWKIFPNGLDFVVMAAWVFIAQFAVITVAAACGITIPDLGAVHSPDAETSLSASLDMARTLTLVYAPSMLLAIIGILLYGRLRGYRGRIAGIAPAGLNPSLLLGGFIWMLAAEIVFEPLLALMPDIPDTVGRGFFALLVTVILAPVFEELLCRGIVLEAFRAKYGTFAGWLCSSLFFALIHGHTTSMVNALLIGSILGYICLRSRSILSSMILHALNNGMALTAISFGLGSSTFADIIPDRRIYFAVYGVSLIICLIGAASMTASFVGMRKAEKDNGAERQ